MSGQKSEIFFNTWTLSDTFNSVVHQALGSDGSRSELLLHRFTVRHIRHDSGHNSLQNFLSFSSFQFILQE